MKAQLPGYLGNRMGYPHHILNKHNKSVDNTKSGEKNMLTFTAFSLGRSCMCR